MPVSFSEVILKRLNIDKLYEIRLRAEKPVTVAYGGTYFYLCQSGIKETVDGIFICTKKQINDIVIRACECSLYAYNDRICNGFLTINGGIRIGIGGEIVSESGVIKTVKNFTSLNIRIPHEVLGCGQRVYDYCCKNEILNTLIISPPGCGKTTILRDISRMIGTYKKNINVLLVDERSEIASVSEGISQLNIGLHTDVISNCSKDFAFKQAIRALRPDVILTDELFGTQDIVAVEQACACGVNVFASVHAKDQLDLINKMGFEGIIKKHLFQRFVCLSSRHGPGTIDGVYDGNFNSVYSM